MATQATGARLDDFTAFYRVAEPRLRRALVAAYGIDMGKEATARALEYGWKHWDRVQSMANPVGYLHRVGRTRGLDFFRRKPPRLPFVPPEEPAWIEPGLPAAFERLSRNQRTAVFLRHGYGWTYREVADLLGTSISTVQKHVERGMAKLRTELGVSSDA